MTLKCFICLKEEHQLKRKWSQIADAITIMNGYPYCYEHLTLELEWKKKKEK
jgi:hypothetical protein